MGAQAMKYGAGGIQVNTMDDFWAKVDKRTEDDCWPWKQALFTNGYGRFKQNYQSVRAHRIALEAVKGPAPVNKPLALHECLMRHCCNPNHLYWGTHEENMKTRAMHYKPRALTKNNDPARHIRTG